jgi:hypothetical protein
MVGDSSAQPTLWELNDCQLGMTHISEPDNDSAKSWQDARAGVKTRIAEQLSELRNKKQRACTKNLMQALDLFGARTRNRTGTPLRAGDFKSHASTSFAIRAVAL